MVNRFSKFQSVFLPNSIKYIVRAKYWPFLWGHMVRGVRLRMLSGRKATKIKVFKVFLKSNFFLDGRLRLP